ncbi:response regulator [Ectobacillus ponti]|uniref:Response regulator n=1 Tax=Ectobacillus ponti TaxID=2961894 RepID=A0AA41X554_9BACI|nr:response regulator [Ectobacillus ponti]MCP8968942.1 response regulator [Ectobacillus ponti]
MKETVHIVEVQPDSVLAEDVLTDSGLLLVKKGTLLTGTLLEKLRYLGVGEVALQNAPAEKPPASEAGPKAGMRMVKRVMVVDDLPLNRRLISNILQQSFPEAEVIEASDGLSAVDMYAYVKPDLVFMDIVMPAMDGITAIRKMKETDPQANVIVCSTQGESKMVLAAIHSGAKDFIVKPYSRSRVMQAVERVMGV